MGYEPLSGYAVAAGDQYAAWTIQTSVTGRLGKGTGGAGDPGYDIKNSSAQIALARNFGSFRIGGAFMVGKTESDWDNQVSSDSTDFAGTIFARQDSGDYYVSGQIFAGHSRVESTRHPGLGLVAKGDYDVSWLGGSLSVARLFMASDWRFTPRLGVTYDTAKSRGFTETGAGNLNLRYSDSNADSLEIETGLFISRDIPIGGSGKTLTPRFNIGVAYETMDTEVTVATNFAEIPGIPSFVGTSQGIGRFRAIAEVGGDLTVSENLDVFLDYRASFRHREQFHSGTLGVKINY
jgi:uncharacterized protein with beta-barrel porin domain